MPASLARQPAVDKSGDRVRRMFAQIAGRYDLLNHVLSLNIDRYWRKRTVQLVPPLGQDPILDVCTGTGDLALAYGKVARGAPIVGLDFCHEMLQVARAKKQRRCPADPLRFVEADAMRLPFPDDHFQIVCVAFGLRNIEDTDQGLREMVRVCRQEGRVAVLEFSSPSFRPLKTLYGFYFRHLLPRVGQWLARNDHEAYRYLPRSVGEFPSGAELAQRMQAAGLRQTRYHPLTLGISTLYIGVK